jgi:hypothetical protein
MRASAEETHMAGDLVKLSVEQSTRAATTETVVGARVANAIIPAGQAAAERMQEKTETAVTTPQPSPDTSEIHRLIKGRLRTVIACAVIFVLSFSAVVGLSAADLRAEHPFLLWSLFAVALVALGAGLVVGTSAAGLVQARRRIERESQAR